MRVAMKVDYGVRALVELAQRGESRPLPTAEIASRQDIPEPYLDQVLSVYRGLGLSAVAVVPGAGTYWQRMPARYALAWWWKR